MEPNIHLGNWHGVSLSLGCSLLGNQRAKVNVWEAISCLSWQAPYSTFYWAITPHVHANYEIYQKAYPFQFFVRKHIYMHTQYKNEKEKKKKVFKALNQNTIWFKMNVLQGRRKTKRNIGQACEER